MMILDSGLLFWATLHIYEDERFVWVPGWWVCPHITCIAVYSPIEWTPVTDTTDKKTNERMDGVWHVDGLVMISLL